MRGKSVVFFLALALGTSVAFAQAPGGLRGTIKDTQGGLLPGVTVTAASPDALAPAVAITAADGTYRLINLAPGTYTITAELAGFDPETRRRILRDNARELTWGARER